jgi:hypothetical protein
MLSDVLRSMRYGQDGHDVTLDDVAVMAHGCLKADHAASFMTFLESHMDHRMMERILSGEEDIPRDPAKRSTLHFIANGLKALIIKRLPKEHKGLTAETKLIAHNFKRILKEVSSIHNELAMSMISESEHGNIPDWLITEIARDLPRISGKG